MSSINVYIYIYIYIPVSDGFMFMTFSIISDGIPFQNRDVPLIEMWFWFRCKRVYDNSTRV